MPIVVIEAVAPVASWRPPEALTYHRTLPLPPYTTLVGMLGAVFGFDLPSAYRFVDDRKLRLGVGGWHEGHARDLWKFQKLGDNEVKGDVLLREYWIDVRLVLVVETPNLPTAELVAEAFRHPAFPLTGGTSDALMKVVAVHVKKAELQETRRLAHGMVYGEIGPRYGLFEKLSEIPLHRTVRAPTVERLPTGFVFELDSPRRLLSRELVTFVADPIELEDAEQAVNGYEINPQSSFLLQSRSYAGWKDQFPWVIPVHRYDSPPTPEETSLTKPSPSGKTPTKSKTSRATGST